MSNPIWSKVRGTIESIWQFGLGGPQIKANSTALEARNAADSGFAVMRGATPVGDDDFTTKRYTDQLGSLPIALQFNGNNALPSNSSTERYYIVSTTGPNATIGQLLWDDGTNTGTVAVMSAVTGRMIGTEAAFSGGTVTFAASSLYMWSGAAWTNMTPAASSGGVFEIRFAINNSASQSSATQVPANAVVIDAQIDVTTPFSAGATISVGQTGSASLLMGTGDNLATVVGLYEVPQDTAWGASALAVLVTVGGSPSAGVAQVIVRYTVPNA